MTELSALSVALGALTVAALLSALLRGRALGLVYPVCAAAAAVIGVADLAVLLGGGEV